MLEKIEQLAQEKAFESLSSAEKSLVLSCMPKEEYDQIHRMLRKAMALDASVQAPARLRANLMAQYPKTPGLGYWAIGIALGILATGGWLLWQFRPVQIQEKIVPVVQVKTDTVWMERVVWREKVVYKPRLVPPQAPVQEPVSGTSTIDEPIARFLPEPVMQAPKGTSLGDTPELMSFFTQGDR